MNNFEYSNPTRLVFGKGEESRIGELMRARVPAMSPVLVVYGGGSAKESGLLERISESLKAADLVPIELGGVTPNPQLSLFRRVFFWPASTESKLFWPSAAEVLLMLPRRLRSAFLTSVMFGISSQRKLRRQKRFRLPLCSRFLLQAANRVSVL